MGNIVFRNKYENMDQIIKENNGLIVVYGVTCAEVLSKKSPFRVDYFVDKRADDIKRIHDIEVLTPCKFESVAKEEKNKVSIIICVDFSPSTITRSIYEDIVKLDVNADVFDYFACDMNFTNDSFAYKGNEYSLFEHSFNCGYKDTRMTERAIEIPIAERWIQECADNIVEVGAVTPYYFKNKKITEIIDPTDLHLDVTKHESIFDCDLTNENVLSISTIEHIGTDDYGLDIRDSAKAGLMKILEESKSCLVTFPLGYNIELDEWVSENRDYERVSVLTRGMNNEWKELKVDEEIYAPFLLFFGACGLVVIEKGDNRYHDNKC